MFENSQDDLFLFPTDSLNEAFFPEEGLGSGSLSLAKALLPLVDSPSPPMTPWLCSTRYKTELCSRYAETGTCKYAECCQFAHGLHDLHVPSCHPKYKTELCRTYHTAGYCVYGTRCLFVHNLKEQRPVRQRRRSVPCRTFRAFGVCPFGNRCHFLHVGAVQNQMVGRKSEPGNLRHSHKSGSLVVPSVTPSVLLVSVSMAPVVASNMGFPTRSKVSTQPTHPGLIR